MSNFSRRDFLHRSGVVAGTVLLVSKETLSAQAAGHKIVRKEIRSYTADELKRFRAAFAQLEQTSGFQGFQTIAGYHGVPGFFCHNDGTIFLPWHRAYIYRIEAALRKIDSTVSLPYWDWTSPESIRNGIPDAYAETNNNPLSSALIGSLNRQTGRNPRQPAILQSLANLVDQAYGNRSYGTFNNAINGPHGSLHGWVGGDMSGVSYAAYDPIFFAHHGTVDFQWAQWQAGPNNQDPPRDIAQKTLVPFKNPIDANGPTNLTVADVVDYEDKLGYVYDGLQPKPVLPTFNIAGIARGEGDITFRIPTARTVSSVVLYCNGVRDSDETYLVNSFLNFPAANADSSLDDQRYSGSFGFFGHGKGHHHTDTDTANIAVLDLTKQVDKLRKAGESRFHVKLVATDANGKGVDAVKLPFDTLSVDIS